MKKSNNTLENDKEDSEDEEMDELTQRIIAELPDPDKFKSNDHSVEEEDNDKPIALPLHSHKR